MASTQLTFKASPPGPSEVSLDTSIVETPASSIAQPLLTQSAAQPVTPLPLSSTNTVNQIQPSPITKKLSLSEYFSKRKGPSNSGEKSMGSPEMTQSAFKPPSMTNGDSKPTIIANEESTIVDSPKEQRASDPMDTVQETKEEDVG